MGWKSTIEISRSEAINLIIRRLTDSENLSNRELEDILEGIGFGDNLDLPYYGYNFNIVDLDSDLEN